MRRDEQESNPPEDGQALNGDALLDAGRQSVVRCAGVSEVALRRDEAGIRESLAARGWEYVVCDARQVEPWRSALQQALGAWAHACGEAAQLADVESQLDTLSLLMRMQPGDGASERQRMVCDAVVGVSEALTECAPAVLMVVAPERLTALERAGLRALISYHVQRPMELPGSSARQVVVAVVGDVRSLGDDLDVVAVDMSGSSRERTQRFLLDDRVLERVLASTGGCPERLEAMLASMPSSADELAMLRVERLSPTARNLLDALSVAGRELELTFLDGMIEGAMSEALRELRDAGLVHRRVDAGSVQLSVASSEVGAAAVASLMEPRRQQIHAALAQRALACSSHGDSGFIAHHALEAGDRELGVRFGLPAARQMMQWGRWDEAGDLVQRLLAEALEEETKAEVHELGAALAEARGDWLEAVSHCGRLRRFAREREARASLEMRIAALLLRLGRPELARDRYGVAERQLEVSDASSPQTSVLRLRLKLGQGEVAYQLGEHEAAAACVASVLETGQTLSPELVASVVVGAHSLNGKVSLFRGDLEGASQAFARSASLAGQHNLPAEVARAEANLGVVAVQTRDYDEAERRLRRALEQSQAGLASVSRLNCWLNLGIVHQRRSEYGEALSCFERSLRAAQAERHEVAFEVASHNLVTLLQDLGAFAAAWELVERLEQRPAVSGHFAGRWSSMLRGQLLLDQGRLDEAVSELARAEDELSAAPRLYAVEMRLRRAEALIALGQQERAREVLDAASAVEDAQSQALHRKVSALLLDGKARAEELRDVIAELSALGLFRDAMDASVACAQALEEVGEHDRAMLVVERALSDLRERARRVPETFRAGFFEVPVHRRLVELFQSFDGQLPDDVIVPDVDRDTSNDQATKGDPAFDAWRARYAEMVGRDARLMQVFRSIDRVGPGETTVLLSGESGTGKELAAAAIHRQSPRASRPFVKVNCAAFVEELLLSELFGHEKGAFTGAMRQKEGLFEVADGGTLFLDEIGDISAKTQVALLRVLQEGTFERVGGTETLSVDVRVVAATNRDLEELVGRGLFRLDLYYRLKGFVIELPALRERREDIPLLLDHFASKFSKDTPAPSFAPEVVQYLARYRWRGNIRELENFVRSVLLFVEGGRVEMRHLDEFGDFFANSEVDETLPEITIAPRVEQNTSTSEVAERVEVANAEVYEDPEEALIEQIVADGLSLSRLKKRLEHECIKRALEETGGNITKAAEILQLKRPRLSQIINASPELTALKEQLVG
ncbi:tetratricopeptide repeat protein [Lujinxingia vulgaris]|uniref:Tetratricopeptide repeat protein n=1 Tax=Lujinxingia vulgaris TaxID=2600176 RepID=A0A5C6XLH5_9DELT|nr:sigma 54-interacting transcriptional regulator [Lujinxingia vulgaris]TXD39906.1 tetratricopeptide repeat protein [Lujinxingia vulgaris]